jgi:hypothetical protein
MYSLGSRCALSVSAVTYYWKNGTHLNHSWRQVRLEWPWPNPHQPSIGREKQSHPKRVSQIHECPEKGSHLSAYHYFGSSLKSGPYPKMSALREPASGTCRPTYIPRRVGSSRSRVKENGGGIFNRSQVASFKHTKSQPGVLSTMHLTQYISNDFNI